MPAYDKIWIIGDEFVANTYDQYVKNAVRKNELYMKTNYDISCYATKSKDSNIRSILGRIKFQLIKALEKEATLPKSILFLLDDDIICRVELKISSMDGFTMIMNIIMKWLLNQVRKAIEVRKDQLQPKSIKEDYPVVYWIEAPQHINFNNNLQRRKFNSAIQNESSVLMNMRIMRMKKVWDPEETGLFIPSSNCFTSDGIFKYWGSIDNALEFNDKKKVEAAGKKFDLNKKAGKPVRSRFNKYRWQKGDDDNRETNVEEYRFKLPKPKSLNFDSM